MAGPAHPTAPFLARKRIPARVRGRREGGGGQGGRVLGIEAEFWQNEEPPAGTADVLPIGRPG
jgi:hypothetical protein